MLNFQSYQESQLMLEDISEIKNNLKSSSIILKDTSENSNKLISEASKLIILLINRDSLEDL